MANARLKLARQASRRRRRNDAQHADRASAEAPHATAAASASSAAENERFSAADEEQQAVMQALQERKTQLETRVEELTLGKAMVREAEPGCDASGRRLRRAHRDYLLQEMEWMAADFAQERKWRLKSARSLAQALVSHLDKQEARVLRQKKSEEQAKRRTAARVGRDVKKFWVKIDKIIAYKVKLQADELRHAAMQRHLSQLVEQTEQYASALTASFQESAATVPDEQQSVQDSRRPRRRRSARRLQVESAQTDAVGDAVDAGDSDFEMEQEEEDDERSIAADERRTTQQEVDEELQLLQKEGDLTVDELRARYAALEGAEDPAESEAEADSGSDGDFELTEEQVDDESSIAEEERRSGPVSRRAAAAEVARLQEESELSIDELRARYAAMEEDTASSGSEMDEEDGEVDADDEFVLTRQAEAQEADDESTLEAEERLAEDDDVSEGEELRLLQEEGELSVEQLRARYTTATADSQLNARSDESSGESEAHDRANQSAERAAAMIRSASSSPRTLVAPSSGRRGYKRPFLLTSRLELREYQEAGVNWLLSMCEKRINGILADEMGLGKTIQTISLLAHLACTQGLWGPHLIVVPTSCLVNWEMEFKRWCPAFKVLTYFGSAKRRKELRQGWSKQNAFQVCITSYQLVVQDAHCFKRKKWYYLILDEAHNIKNWKSLRWQTLLTFSSQRRLLLTGTPLQNNLLELWALMHFLMPHVFASRHEFSYWFQNPLALLVENNPDATSASSSAPQQGNTAPVDDAERGNRQLVTKLHGIIRPFVLRRLKKDVAKQLPGKFEHVVSCQLSRRQRALYEDFISRSSTRRAMFGRGKGRGANFMSMMNVLMQLRKVCNHPDLFEPRPIASPLDMAALRLHMPSRCGFLVDELVNARPSVGLWNASGSLVNLELLRVDKYSARRRRELFFYDVSAPVPDDATAAVSPAYANKKDIARRLMQLAVRRRSYWEQKRVEVARRHKLCVELLTDDPMYGDDLIHVCTLPVFISPAMDVHVQRVRPRHDALQSSEALQTMVQEPEARVAAMLPIVTKAVCYVPKARARTAQVLFSGRFLGGGAFALSRKARLEAMERELAQPVAQRVLAPFHEAFKRTQLFFPDKALVQFDCGKLQQLAILLRTLKRGGHRCLIFTQMSSMLNILEVFLNLHGHTYFRLDGATKVERRQALMERFNRDEKIFCFILSTRSGGLGINLTGADAVIFYDSDWNPAMDAQAQDRAHRIGQTRDVHIYRLVTQHTVEENILRRAQQKRHLDFLVMAEGQFTTDFFSKSSLRELMTDGVSGHIENDDLELDDDSVEGEEDAGEPSVDAVERAMAQLEDEDDVVAMRGARAEFIQEQREFDEETGAAAPTSATDKRVAGLSGGAATSRPSTPSSSVAASTPMSENDATEEEAVAEDDEENTVSSAEEENDSDDSSQENSTEEMDDSTSVASVQLTKSSRKRRRDASVDKRRAAIDTKRTKLSAAQPAQSEKGRERARERAEEKKLQAWKASVSSLQNFEDSLNAVDRYALHFREDVDPLYEYSPAQQAAMLAGVDPDKPAPELTLLQDIARVDEEKRQEEARLIADGELLAGRMDEDDPETNESAAPGDASTDADMERVTRYEKLYRRERAHVHFERRKRLLTGASWSVLKCAKSGQPFYFNADTREAIWDKPAVLIANEQLTEAHTRGYEGLPQSALLRVLQFLEPMPGRYHAQMVCRNWHSTTQHHSLFVKVTAGDVDDVDGDEETVKRAASKALRERLASVAAGDTVLFGPGVYVLTEALEISTPMRLLATPDTHVELQMCSGEAQLRWTASGGVICGFHLTRTSSSVFSSVAAAAGDASAVQSPNLENKSEKAPDLTEMKTASATAGIAVAASGTSTTLTPARLPQVASESKDATPTVSTKKPTAAKEERKRIPTALEIEAARKNWQHLLRVEGNGRVRMEYCELDGNGLGSACVCVWGRGSLKKHSNNTSREPTTEDPAQDAVPDNRCLLVAHNCRIRGAGSSGVLVVRGALVLALSSVEENAHSGVTVLGGRAALRRNKIQRNGRFGLRLLYHAGHVVVEENAILGNPCGNLDVDNSGRRFVVRWNDLDKDNVPDEELPHAHGRLRLETLRVVEKEVPRKTPPKPVVKKPVLLDTQPAASYSAASLVEAWTASALIPIAAGPAALIATSAEMPAGKPGLPTPAVLQASTAASSAAPVAADAPSSMAGAPPVKKRRKRRPRMMQVVERGFEVLLCDTCEKRGEKKVVKPRLPKASTPTTGPSAIKQEPASTAVQATTAGPSAFSSSSGLAVKQETTELDPPVASLETHDDSKTAKVDAQTQGARGHKRKAGESTDTLEIDAAAS